MLKNWKKFFSAKIEDYALQTENFLIKDMDKFFSKGASNYTPIYLTVNTYLGSGFPFHFIQQMSSF